ncbi:hypothetical protein ACFO1B_46005 [Dactylosporangium siamense]|uniref:Uncharacterized protein n=1 Tax=Dactylosporangium siamense TaxID=685454 RepID=A0A919PNS1_9ACTN|nr:hypothetical protein [Dactylosporangium siamense]GIG45755.1 hypothetical protein Dsi01nite_037960 [Dactylosporangium siamense]
MRVWKTAALGGITLLVTLSGTVLVDEPAYSHAVAGNPSAASNTAACTRPFTVVQTSAIDVAGNVVANRALAGHATEYTYTTGTGDDIREIAPPEGWSPLRATDAELGAYGFPPRPVDAQGRAAWEKTMAGWKRAGRPEMCGTDVQATVTHTEQTSNWAGGMAVNGSATISTFTTAEGRWYQPSFSSYCGLYGTSYGIWSGLGGFNQNRLIQSGVDNSGLDLNSSQMFWEMINPKYDTHEVRWTDVTVPANHQVQSYVTYSGGEASMWVADLTDGVSHAIVVTTIQNYLASSFYDGTTAEFITEPATVSGTTLPLSRPVGDQTTYYYATVNGQPIANFSSWRLHQGLGGWIQLSGFDGIHAWNDFWRHCT